MQYPKLQPIESATKNDSVYEAVRQLVMHGALEPGQFLREPALCERLNVSRTPVREALGRLASEGLVERIPHRGFRMREISFKEIHETYPIIATLEELAGKRSLPRLTRDDLSKARSLNTRLFKAVRKRDAQQATRLNNQFHELLCSRAENHRLTEMLKELRAQTTLIENWFYTHYEHAENSPLHHDVILEALESGDHRSALREFRRDYKDGLTLVRAAMEKSETNKT